MARTTLTSVTWIEAAFRALTIGGLQAVRIEAIARSLKVSKGSFYWHFVNLSELKTQMLQHWKEEATDNIIALLEDTEMSASDRLRTLVEVATGDTSARYGGVMVEAAIRDWAKYDTLAEATVKAVDVERLSFLNRLFKESGFNKKASHANSVILYGALIGLGALSHSGLADLKTDLSCLLETLLLAK
jgi:AcrR family transcriptional regulator